MSILLVEDNPAFARLTTLQLTAVLGDEVHVEHCLTLAAAIAAGSEPDCVLLDLNLPDGAGMETIGRLRTGGVTAPVVVLSGHSDPTLAARARAAGAADFVAKGATPEALVDALRAALGR